MPLKSSESTRFHSRGSDGGVLVGVGIGVGELSTAAGALTDHDHDELALERPD